MTTEDEKYERRRAEDAVRDNLQTQISHIETLATIAKDGLEKHIAHCAKVQTYGAIVGTATLSWLIGHSPEAERIAAKIFNILVP